jgi:hypothetical protein
MSPYTGGNEVNEQSPNAPLPPRGPGRSCWLRCPRQQRQTHQFGSALHGRHPFEAADGPQPTTADDDFTNA